MDYRKLLESIEGREARVSVVGLGYIGLPMAAVVASRGYQVTGIDINPSTVRAVNSQSSPINEPGLKELVEEVVGKGNLKATLNQKEIGSSEVVIIVVQTPIGEDRKPRLDSLKSACRSVSQNLSPGTLVLVESTIPPGTTRQNILPLLEESGLKAGEDFYLAYSPERAIPTSTLKEIRNSPRVVGGIEEKSSVAARTFYSNITGGEVVSERVEEVEVVKVIENTFRDVNIALANEVALFCEALGVDSLKAIELANRHPRVNFHHPGPGVGGHCIPKDPHFLISKAEELGVELKLIKAARERNSSMPGHVLRKLEDALAREGKELEKSKVAILGLAYKGNTEDVRDTPAEPIVRSLMHRGSRVFSHDPVVNQDFGGPFSNNIEEAIEGADALVLLTDHDYYKKLPLDEIRPLLKENAVVIDGRRIFSREDIERLEMRYYGIGC